MLLEVAGNLVKNTPFLVFAFFLAAGMSCLFTMSFEPMRKMVDMVKGFVVGAWQVITGIVGAIKDLIQWW